MSVKISSIVWDMRGLTVSQKMVLLRLADHSSDTGDSIFPAVSTTAEKCCMDRRTVQRTLRSLEDMKIISVVGQSCGGRNNTTHYMINVAYISNWNDQLNSDTTPPFEQIKGGTVTPFEEIKGGTVSQKGGTVSQKGGTVSIKGGTVPPEPSLTIINHHEPLRAEAAKPPDDLDKILYQRGKALLGKSAGGQITRLKNNQGIGRALELLEQARRKENPIEWIAGVINEKTLPKHTNNFDESMRRAALEADAIIKEREATGYRI